MQFSLPNIIIGLIGLTLGFYLIKEAFYLNHHVLFLEWVEKKWGPGKGTDGYKVIGIILCIFSVFVILGIVNIFDQNSLTSLTPNQQNINTQPNNNRRLPVPSKIAD